MKPINSPQDFETMLQAEHAVLFIFFPWSAPSIQSEAVVAEWQSKTAYREFPVFQLTPDGHLFCWQWLDTIFDAEPEANRTKGAIVWLRTGSVAAVAPDAARAGIKMIDRVTSDCFVLGKTHTSESIALLQNEPPPFDLEFLKILCCPETHQALSLVEASVLDRVNLRLVAGGLLNRGGQPVREKIEDGLVRADGRYLYPMRRNIPVLLVDEAIPLAG